jgi:Asp-tRNA(Asn)/Glu-tRNA(Gln) amidotransferase A subunit family amidase
LNEAFKKGRTHELPPLFGIPISIKDCINVKGARTTLGCYTLANNVATENSPTVQMFIDAGAIPLVKGNIPQLLMSIHSENAIYGCAKNPYDLTRSSGGSSGGDCSLIAAKCIPLALGNDIGGSIRVPCAFNGIRGFKPTPERVS